jgi:hypothetical protein
MEDDLKQNNATKNNKSKNNGCGTTLGNRRYWNIKGDSEKT